MDWLSGVELNTLPIWIVALAVVLRLLPATIKELGVFVPSLGRWVEQREAIVHHRLDSEAAEQSHEVLMDMKLLGLLEESLRQSWHAGERIEARMAQMVQAVDRNNGLLTALNSTMSHMCEQYAALLGYVKEKAE